MRLTSGRPLRWFEIPIVLGLVFLCWVPVIGIFSRRVPLTESVLAVWLVAFLAGLCFAGQSLVLAYFQERPSWRALVGRAAWSFAAGTVLVVAWLSWHR